MSPRVIVAGGGIGGLAAACALLRKGISVVVLEQSAGLSEVGAGLQISANGTKALFDLGLEDELQRVWCEPTGKEVRMWNSGESWKLFDLGTVSRELYGAPYFMIHRADLHRVLYEAVVRLQPDAVRMSARCIGARQDERGVTVDLESGEQIRADALIAADGVHSVIRNNLVGEEKPEFTGCVAWRGLIATDRLPERLRRKIGVNWVGPGGHVVHYLLRGGDIFNFVGIVERDDWRVESWTEVGTTEECLRDFEGWDDDIHLIIRNLERPYKWALLSRQPLDRWVWGRIALLGDAAHPTLPMMAQGGNMALEDGTVLARCFEVHDNDVPSALRSYEGARLERTGRLVQAANENARRFHNPVLRERDSAKQYVDREWAEDRVRQRYDWVFTYDPVTVRLSDAG
jgi:2-polyprenyl-6-methoxyphenol hydroxylase-like FAD-dependent oxidoreductase